MNAIYTSPKGKPVTEFSHSAANEYRESPAKFYWKRICGYYDRLDSATMQFGLDIQEAVRRFYMDRADPVETIGNVWAARKEQELDYGEKETWETLDQDAQGMMRAFKKEAREFRKPFFPRYKDRYKITVNGACYVSIPDIVDSDAHGVFTADIKSLVRRVNDAPFAAVMDSQLRTQAAVTGVHRVVLWVFARTPVRSVPTVEEVRGILSGHPPAVMIEAARKGMDLTVEEAGNLLEIADPKAKAQEYKRLAKASPDLPPLTEKLTTAIAERCSSEYPIQWLEAEMTREWANEALRADLSLVPHIQAGEFPCRCGIRWPSDTMARCPYRGLCLERAAANATEEQKTEWRKITETELKRWDEGALEGLE